MTWMGLNNAAGKRLLTPSAEILGGMKCLVTSCRSQINSRRPAVTVYGPGTDAF